MSWLLQTQLFSNWISLKYPGCVLDPRAGSLLIISLSGKEDCKLQDSQDPYSEQTAGPIIIEQAPSYWFNYVVGELVHSQPGA